MRYFGGVSNAIQVPGLPERLKRARDLASLTQRQLATKMGIRSVTVSEWERGHSTPHAAYLKLLAKTLNVSADWLLGAEAVAS